MSVNKKRNDLESRVEDIRFKASNSIEKNQKTISIIVGIVVLIVAGFFGYKYLIKVPKEKEAQAAIFHAEKYFGVDSFQLALDGDGLNDGFLKVISNYSGTPSANLAYYYAGICYLNLGQPQEAINHLDKFNAHGTDFAQSKVGLTASAYYELGDENKALELYQKAISMPTTIFTPQYLRAASILLFKNGKVDEAVSYEKRIKQEFTSSLEFRDADRYLAQYGVID